MDPRDASTFNRPKTDNEMVNGNGCRLHFRVERGVEGEAKRVLFYIPGYSGHINRPEFFAMTRHMNSKGTIVIAADMQGHGYSEGERCLMLDHRHLLDDVTSLVDAFMNPRTTERLSFCSKEGSFQQSDIPSVQKLPFFIMGSSMGGAISTMVAQRLYAAPEKYPTFKGAILLAPALSFKTPSWLVVETLRYTVGTCAPTALMPPSMNDVSDNTKTFKHPDSLLMCEADSWGKEGGLGWNQGMRWGTALMFVDFAPVLRDSMPTTAHPFLIIHDPADEICSIKGSQMLMEKSLTPQHQKQLIEVPGYLHGLLANETAAVCDLALSWMATADQWVRTDPVSGNGGAGGQKKDEINRL